LILIYELRIKIRLRMDIFQSYILYLAMFAITARL